jgi:hypothetical protein
MSSPKNQFPYTPCGDPHVPKERYLLNGHIKGSMKILLHLLHVPVKIPTFSLFPYIYIPLSEKDLHFPNPVYV